MDNFLAIVSLEGDQKCIYNTAIAQRRVKVNPPNPVCVEQLYATL